MSRVRTQLSKFRAFYGLAILCSAIGCASSERQAAKQLDPTSSIVQEASSLLAADKELGRLPVELDGFKGAMRLRGQVATEAQKMRAAQIVWAVRGVRSVENDLSVTSGARR